MVELRKAFEETAKGNGPSKRISLQLVEGAAPSSSNGVTRLNIANFAAQPSIEEQRTAAEAARSKTEEEVNKQTER